MGTNYSQDGHSRTCSTTSGSVFVKMGSGRIGGQNVISFQKQLLNSQQNVNLEVDEFPNASDEFCATGM